MTAQFDYKGKTFKTAKGAIAAYERAVSKARPGRHNWILAVHTNGEFYVFVYDFEHVQDGICLAWAATGIFCKCN